MPRIPFFATKPPADVLNVDFRSLIRRNPDFYNDALSVGGGYFLSVQASASHYCTPQANLLDISRYVFFEVALTYSGEPPYPFSEVLKEAPHRFQEDEIWGWASVAEVQEIYRWLIWNLLWN